MKKRCILILVAVVCSWLFFSCNHAADPIQDQGYIGALKMVGAGAFFDDSLRGKGVKIGILDIGFGGVDKDPALRHLTERGQIAWIKNYVADTSANLYKSSHGTAVLRYLGGILPDDTLFGGSLARDATFFLSRVARGEGVKEDLKTDEMNIDSALSDLFIRGVKLVNLSLGFWDEFMDVTENYSADQMDGKSTVITRICEKWAAYGMIIVCSAGNTGEYSWRVIWAPADGPHVITAGDDRFTDKVFKASYSGRGNPDVSFVKPDVICYSPSGTSFTTPVITGMIACILQKDSTLSPALVRELLHRSSGLFPYPNNYVGYGVPDASRILRCLDNPGYEHGLVSIIRETGKSVTISTDSENIVVFEKSDDYIVKRQYTAKATTGTFSISRSSGVKRTTVALGLDEFFEIFWD